MTIRSTKNATIKTISGSTSNQSKEICEGSLDGIAASQIHEMSGDEWEANNTANPNNTVTKVPSDYHWN